MPTPVLTAEEAPDTAVESHPGDTTAPLLEQIESELADQNAPLPYFQVYKIPADFSLERIVEKWRNAEIRIPRFAHSLVWTVEHSSKLIDSFLRGFPVPPIHLYWEQHDPQATKEPQLLVVDGQQRLRTIIDFFQGQEGASNNQHGQEFRLTGLEPDSPFEGLCYEDLSPAEFDRLNKYTLRCNIIRPRNPDDDTSIFHLFERLNASGTRPLPQEIRSFVYGGALSDLLVELNTFPAWRSIIGTARCEPRLRDVELILRFFALLEQGENYKNPMKLFLNRYLASNCSLNDTRRWRYHSTFTRTATAALEHLGETPFHIRSGLNAAVFDSVLVAIARNIDRLPNDLDERYRTLIDRTDFLSWTTSDTTSPDIVAQRIAQATTAFGALGRA